VTTTRAETRLRMYCKATTRCAVTRPSACWSTEAPLSALGSVSVRGNVSALGNVSAQHNAYGPATCICGCGIAVSLPNRWERRAPLEDAPVRQPTREFVGHPAARKCLRVHTLSRTAVPASRPRRWLARCRVLDRAADDG